MKSKFCKYCGNKIIEKTPVCSKCGKKIEKNNNILQTVDKLPISKF